MAAILATKEKNITAPFSLLFFFPDSEVLGQILLLVILVQPYCLLQACAFGKKPNQWGPPDSLFNIPLYCWDTCMTRKGQIIFGMGKTLLTNKPAHASTQGGKRTRTEPKPTEVLTHLQVSRASPRPADRRRTARLTGDAGDRGRARQVPSTVPAPPSASRRNVGIAPGCLAQRRRGRPAGPLSKHLVPAFTIQLTSPQCFEELELPGAELLHFFHCRGRTVGTSPKETGRRRFLKKGKEIGEQHGILM